ncbi:hypothetical protein [Rhodanobacter sp. FW106-PBR-R2A-1-13]|uniref:hypothetical protein n=1 Tax=Rhodanobacter sp. FW106-PBR-R2A-1-13 TaxID=3454845 RepID=UPI0034E5B0F5
MANPIYDTGGRPVNRVAKDVIGGGEHYEHVPKGQSNVDQQHAYPTRELAEIPVNLRHLLGYRYGRLTVVGLALVPSRWVVRCNCGTYSLRTTKAICNPINNIDSCQSCQHKLFLRRREIYQRTGREPELADVPGACPNKPPLPPPVKAGTFKSRPLGAKDFTARPWARPNDPVRYSERLAQMPTTMQTAMDDAIAAKTRPPTKR